MLMCVSLLVSGLSHCSASKDLHTHSKTGFHPAAAHLSSLITNHCPAANHTHHGPDFHTYYNFLETSPSPLFVLLENSYLSLKTQLKRYLLLQEICLTSSPIPYPSELSLPLNVSLLIFDIVF